MNDLMTLAPIFLLFAFALILVVGWLKRIELRIDTTQRVISEHVALSRQLAATLTQQAEKRKNEDLIEDEQPDTGGK